jgi:vacuolar-type H+-ATPase subunit I/STV1
MKNVLRDWLGINEEKFALEVQLNKLQQKLDYLDASYADVDDKVDNLDSEVSDMKYEVEDKVTYSDVEDIVRDVAYYDIDDIKNDLDSDMDYSEITDNVFDLVMQEIENRDTLQELVENKLEALTDEGRNNTGAYPDITEIVEDVVEELINKLRA